MGVPRGGADPVPPHGPASRARRGAVTDIAAADIAAADIDAIIAKAADWRGATLATLREVALSAGPNVLEQVKWRKPSKPEGVPVWEVDGIVCVADTLKAAVRLTFPKGAQVADPRGLFNTRLDSKTVRAIDFHEGEKVPVSALRALIKAAARVNTEAATGKARTR